MIIVTRPENLKIIEVKGPTAELMLFYCFWQTSLWKNWERHDPLHVENDALVLQLKRVVDAATSGQGLTIYYQGDEFKKAFTFAVERCVALGIPVSEKEVCSGLLNGYIGSMKRDDE